MLHVRRRLRKVRFRRLIRSYRFHSLYWRVFLTVLVLVIVPLVGGAVLSFLRMDEVARAEATANYRQALQDVHLGFESLEREIDSLLFAIVTDSNTARFMGTDREGLFPDYESISVMQQIQTLVSLRKPDYVDSVYVYSRRSDYVLREMEGRAYDISVDRSWRPLFETLELGIGATCRVRIAPANTRPYAEAVVLSYFLPYPVLYAEPREEDGMAVANVRLDELERVIAGFSPRHAQSVVIVDRSGIILYHPDWTRVGTPLVESDTHPTRSLSSVSDYKGSRFIVTPHLETIDEGRRATTGVLAVAVLVAFMLSGIVAFSISRRLYAPIQRIIAVIEEATAAEPAGSEEDAQNEFAYITGNIIRSFEESTQLHDETRRQLALLREARAAALQSQINPHFLSNTLQTISWMAMDVAGGDNPVSEALVDLDKLVRMSSATESHLHTLADEIAHAKRYVRIQKLRFQNQVDVRWSVPESIFDRRVIRVCIQPLIENAIDHGIKPTGRPGRIHVSARRAGDRLRVVVSDDGAGLAGGEIGELNRRLEEEYTCSGHHIGLRNVNQRIKLVFGREYGASVRSVVGRYFVVQLEFPWDTHDA